MANIGGTIRSDREWGPVRGTVSKNQFESLMGQEMLGIETGSDTAVFIVKEKASKHFGGTTKDTFPKFDENEQGDHSFINFDSERQMQDWAQHIVADLIQTIYKVDHNIWGKQPKDVAAIRMTVQYQRDFFPAASFKSWKYSREDGTLIQINPDQIQTIDVGVTLRTNLEAETPDGPVKYAAADKGIIQAAKNQVIRAPPTIYIHHGPVVYVRKA